MFMAENMKYERKYELWKTILMYSTGESLRGDF